MKNQQNRLTLFASIALIPSVIFVAVNILKYQLGVPLFYDTFDALLPSFSKTVSEILSITMLMGIPIAFVLLTVPLARIHLSHQGGVLTSTIRIELRAFNLALMGLCMATALIVTVYFFVENFAPRY